MTAPRAQTFFLILLFALTTFAVAAKIRQGPAADLERATALLNKRSGSAALVERDHRNAIMLLERLLANHPASPERGPALFLRARALWGMGQSDSSRVALHRYIKEYPTGQFAITAHYLGAQLDWDANRQDQALERMLEIIKEYPDAPATIEVRLMTARHLVTARRFDEAEPLLEMMVLQGSPQWARSAAEPLLKDVRLGGEPAPSISGNDVDGQPISLSQYYGSVVLIDFWASWCGPCRQTIPHLKSLYARYGSSGLEIMGVSLDQSAAHLKAFQRQLAIPWRSHFDGKGWFNEAARLYDVTAIPKNYLIDRQGRVQAFDLHDETLEKAIADLVGRH